MTRARAQNDRRGRGHTVALALVALAFGSLRMTAQEAEDADPSGSQDPPPAAEPVEGGASEEATPQEESNETHAPAEGQTTEPPGGTSGERPEDLPAAPDGVPDEAPGDETRARPGKGVPSGTIDDVPLATYRDPRVHAESRLAAWLGTGLAEELRLGTSEGGNDLLAVQFGGFGNAPLAARPTVLLLGGLDGVSLSGSEAVLAVVDGLLAAPERLPDDVTFVAVPWANPDGLVRRLSGARDDGGNGRPNDDDHDGKTNEDGPDDLDGDGAILELLVEDPAGAWVRCADGRFLRPALPGEAPRYHRYPEGRDDDGDGLYNEDGPSGVVLDRNFPVGWRGPWDGVASGSWPLSEAAARAIAELAMARRTAVAIVFQGNHGGLASPGGLAPASELTLPLAQDEPVYRAALRLFEDATGRVQSEPMTLFEARAGEYSGAAVDWLYAALGALSMEVAAWGPEVQARGVADTIAREGRFVPLDDSPMTEGFADLPPGELAWCRWLDDTRGGIGFVDWTPVDLGDGRQGLLGGWEPRTHVNAPPEVLTRAVAGLDAFVLDLARALPRLEIELREARRDGEACVLRARVTNVGALPSGVGPGGAGCGVHVELELPEGATLLAGEAVAELGHLPGHGVGKDLGWLLVAPEGSVFRLRVSAPWLVPIEREVRL